MLQTNGIFLVALFFYAFSAMGVVALSGLSMANADGLVDNDYIIQQIKIVTAPFLTYLLGMTIYGVAFVFPKARLAVESAMARMFIFHISWFPLCYVYCSACSLLEKHVYDGVVFGYSSLASKTIRFLGFAWPFLMMSIFFFVCVSKAMSNDEGAD